MESLLHAKPLKCYKSEYIATKQQNFWMEGNKVIDYSINTLWAKLLLKQVLIFI